MMWFYFGVALCWAIAGFWLVWILEERTRLFTEKVERMANPPEEER